MDAVSAREFFARHSSGADVVLMVDAADRQGYAAGVASSDQWARIARALREIWPDASVLVNRWIPAASEADTGPQDGGRLTYSRHFTDVRRLVELRDVLAHPWVVVVRPACVLIPPAVLRGAVQRALDGPADVVTIAGLTPDVFHVVSRRAIALVASAGPIPGAVTVPRAIERLAEAGVTWDTEGLRIDVVAAGDSSCDGALVALPSRWWREVPPVAILDVEPVARLDAALAAERAAAEAARGRVGTDWLPVTPTDDCGAPCTLVVVPSMYQTGAHAAWSELLDDVSPRDVAFLVGRTTALHDAVSSRGFRVFGVRDGLSPSSAVDMAVVDQALRAVQPAIVHLDGAECAGMAEAARARGIRVVQHVRLNVIERFRAVCAHADAVVGVSAWMCGEIARRIGGTARVVHVPDGVRLDTYAPRTPAERAPLDRDTELMCLCAGRVEPAKAQGRVLEIFQALASARHARLTLVGPCGNDASYCDDVLDRIDADPGGRVSWHRFTPSIAHLYRQAHVVLVGSRNEALGMVGLEALAAGALLVAQRSSGYEAIVDPSRHEGLLFDAGDDARAVADRVLVALDRFEAYSSAAVRKAAEAFDARETARRLSSLWTALAARR